MTCSADSSGAARTGASRGPHLMTTCRSIFASSIGRTRGQSSSSTAYHAESRIESGRIMCRRKIPSNRAPTPSSAPRTRRFRASVLNSTRIAPHSSNAFRSSRYFVSTFAPVPHCARSSHVQPISSRRWAGSTFKYRLDPTGRPVDVHDVRHLTFAREREIEPPIEPERVHVREAVDLRLTLRRLAQTLAMTLGDRLEPDDPAVELEALRQRLRHRPDR